jgi:hypothetical protein
VKLILGTIGRITKVGGEGGGVGGGGGTGVGGRCCVIEVVGGIASVKGSKKYRCTGIQFFNAHIQPKRTEESASVMASICSGFVILLGEPFSPPVGATKNGVSPTVK